MPLSTILNFFPLQNLLALAIYLDRYILLKHKDIHRGKDSIFPNLKQIWFCRLLETRGGVSYLGGARLTGFRIKIQEWTSGHL